MKGFITKPHETLDVNCFLFLHGAKVDMLMGQQMRFAPTPPFTYHPHLCLHHAPFRPAASLRQCALLREPPIFTSSQVDARDCVRRPSSLPHTRRQSPASAFPTYFARGLEAAL